MGAEQVRPDISFFGLLERKGFPSRFKRFCCDHLKEYKILDKCVMGIRRGESSRRAERYAEPVQCRFYGSRERRVQAIYPILDWTIPDVVDFVNERGIRLHPLYYRQDGTIDASRRLGCMCCPLASRRKRLGEFRLYPNMARAYIKHGGIYMANHPGSKTSVLYADAYEWFARDVFFERQSEWDRFMGGMFGKPDCRGLLSEYFKIDL